MHRASVWVLDVSRRTTRCGVCLLATAHLPEFCKFICSLLKQRAHATLEGRGEGRVRAAPAVSCAKGAKHTSSHHRFTGSIPAFPAQWFYDFLRALPVTGLCCHRRPREALASHELDASVGASEPHDFAVRVSVVVRAHKARATLPRPPHPAPTSVTIAIRPSLGTGWREQSDDLRLDPTMTAGTCRRAKSASRDLVSSRKGEAKSKRLSAVTPPPRFRSGSPARASPP